MNNTNRECSNTQCSKESCEGCSQSKKSMLEELNSFSTVKNVIGIASGKGGVGKSLVTAMLAVLMNRKGFKVGIMDADITGPSIPKMFGITKKAVGNEFGILPEITRENIKLMSINLLLEKEDQPVVWRGPVLANTVKQFWSDVYWEELDYLFIDMPPGTGDVPLTVFQSIPLDGIVIVSSPQDLVSLIVKKAYNMAQMMDIPILGLVENMSYIKCPDCGKEIKLFGDSKIEEITTHMGIDVLGKIPIDPDITKFVNEGMFENFSCDYLLNAVEEIIKKFSE